MSKKPRLSNGKPRAKVRRPYMLGDRKVTHDAVARALVQYRGNIHAASRKLGVCRDTVYASINENPYLTKLVSDCRESWRDDLETTMVESALGKKDAKGKVIEPPNITAGIFLLKTQCKQRGYIERADLIPMDKVSQLIADLAATIPSYVDAARQPEAREAIQRLIRAHTGNWGTR